MIKSFLIVISLGFVMISNAKDRFELIPTYMLESSNKDVKLKSGESVFEFQFNNVILDGKHQVIYSIDGISDTVTVNGNSFEVFTTPGEHIFQILYNAYYQEIYTGKLLIKDQYRDVYSLNLWDNYMELEVDKPVIYIYPEEEMKISVNLDIKGKEVFTYPPIEGNWEFTAQPNGDLYFGDKVYNYLFWESEQSRYFNHVEVQSGFIVEKENVVSFLESKLTEVGLTSKEQADFITYWAPRMVQFDKTFVRFEFNEECNRYAELDISPTPDQLYRIYMGWMPIFEEMNPAPTPQEIKPIVRKGFVVLEWGGFETILTEIY